jgi:ABC-type transporter Mla MlaB component
VIWITDVRSVPSYTEIDMLTIETLTDGRTASLILTGDLTFDSVPKLEQNWRRICSVESVEIDLCQVGTIDAAGKALLARMFAQGVGLIVGTHASA